MRQLVRGLTVPLVMCATTLTAAEPYLEEDGLLVIEAENTDSSLGNWQVSTSVSDYTGAGFIEFTGNKYQSGNANSPLTYTFTIQNAGVYRLVPRSATTRPDSVPDDQGNDCYLKMSGDFTSGGTADLADLTKNQKFFTILKNANKWTWGRQFDMNNSHDFHEAEYNFKAGETYTLTVSGRSKSYSIDRLVFYRMSDYSASEAQNVSHPESERSGGDGGGGGGEPQTLVLDARDDFSDITAGDVPYYEDSGTDSLAIDASKTANRSGFARASVTFTGETATYDVVLTTVTEEDGESTYRLLIDGTEVATYANPYIGPGSSRDLEAQTHTWEGIEIPEGAVIAIESNADTNGEIPEGNGTAWARGRWQQIELVPENGGGGGDVGNALAGQIIVDPDRGNYFVRNQDLDGDGELDPYMMAGVGGPEQFLYLGTRQSDGTRSGGRQQTIIDELIASGVNGIYLQSLRSFGGDASQAGDETQAPFNDYADPDSGLDPDIMAQWHGWFAQMREADIGILFFIYDDTAKPWGSSGDSVPAGEEAFLTAITNEFEDYPNIIFVMAEEYQYAGFSEARMSNMAAIVAAADDHDHAIGVHHNIGLANQYVGDANIDVYVQQADLRNGDKMDKLHDEYGTDQGFDESGRYAYIMGEGFGYHQNLVGKTDKRDELRRSMYATAMAGGMLTVFGAYEDNWGRDPIVGNLDDMGHLVEFFHSTPFNTMDHNDGLAYGDTDWVKAKEGERYIAYSQTAPTNGMGVKGLPSGTYNLRWFDARDGEWETENGVSAGGDTAFGAPSSMNNDTVLEIILVTGNDNSPPSVNAGNDQTVAFDDTLVALNASVSDDGKPSGALTYAWSQVEGPGTAAFSADDAEDTNVTLPDVGTYTFRLTVNDGELSTSDTVIVTRQPDLGDLVYAVNAGGGSFTGSDGTPYEPDDTYAQTGSDYSKNEAIAGTEDDTIFQTERFIEAPGAVEYAFPVTNGTYIVTLMWSENTATGRIMDVSAEGTLMIDALDVLAEAGASKTAYEQSITVTVNDGSLDLSIAEDDSATELYPNVMGIRIYSGETPANSAPQIAQASPIGVSMSEDATPTAFALTLNATDPDDDALTWSISSAPANGDASASGTGTSKAIGYTPDANYYGSDTFVVQVSDGNGGTDSVTVDVTISNDDVTLTVAAGTGGSVSPVGANATDPSGVTDISATPSTGYRFLVWSGDVTGIADASAAITTIQPTGDQSIQAEFEAQDYTLTFAANGGSAPSVGSKSVTYDAPYGELATISRDGFTFLGWFTAASNGSEISASDTVTTAEDQTLYAHWLDNSLEIQANKSAISIDEGSNASFTVVLSAQPASNVSLTVSRVSGDDDVAVSDGANLTFTTTNWDQPQTVTLAAAEDDADAIAGSATIEIAGGGLDPISVEATEVDNDPAALSLSLLTASISEAGGITEITVVRNTTTIGELEVSLASDEVTEVTVPSTVTIPAGSDRVTAVVTAVDESIIDGDQVVALHAAASGHLAAEIAITVTDNETPGVTVVGGPIQTDEDGGEDDMTVVLNTPPTDPVSVTVLSSDTSEAMILNGAELIFTASNWDTPQTVTLVGVDDSLLDGSVAFIVTLTVTSDDANYAGMVVDPVAATNADDAVSLTISTDGNGSVSPLGANSVDPDADTALGATPSAGYVFDRWIGETTGMANTANAETTINPTGDQTVTATFTAVNSAPAFTSTPVTAVSEDSEYDYTIQVQDLDGDTLEITAVQLPSWLSLVDSGAGQATLSGVPTFSQVGEHSVTLEVSDGVATTQQAFIVMVALLEDLVLKVRVEGPASMVNGVVWSLDTDLGIETPDSIDGNNNAVFDGTSTEMDNRLIPTLGGGG